MIVEHSTYKGNPLIVLKRDENDKYPFSFGVSKAKLAVEAIEDIKKFIAEHESQSASKPSANVSRNSAPMDDDNPPF